MKKTIKRRYEFNFTEVRDAVLAAMVAADCPVPRDYKTIATERADNGGIVLEWTEVDE